MGTENTMDLFIAECLTELLKLGVMVSMPEQRTVDYPGGGVCSGYFVDRPQLRFGVAAGLPKTEWPLVFIHEFCHFQQWKEQIPAWNQVFLPDGSDLATVIDDWADRKLELCPVVIANYIQRIAFIEYDCEMRALDMIAQKNLPIAADVYAKKANAYLYMYGILLKRREWPKPGKMPYYFGDVWMHLPATLDQNYLNPSPEIERILQPCYEP